MGDLVRITGQQEESVLRQMDDRSAGVGEGQYARDTKPSTLTGKECAISQGAQPGRPAKARPRQAECGCLWLSLGIPRLEMRQWRGPLIGCGSKRTSEAESTHTHPRP